MNTSGRRVEVVLDTALGVTIRGDLPSLSYLVSENPLRITLPP